MQRHDLSYNNIIVCTCTNNAQHHIISSCRYCTLHYYILYVYTLLKNRLVSNGCAYTVCRCFALPRIK